MSPILGHIGGLPLHAYGTFLGLAFAAGWIVALLEAQRRGLQLERVAGSFLIAGVSAMVMARVFWVVTNPGQPALGLQGLVAYGGFVGGALGAIGSAKLLKLPVIAWCDCAAPATAVGLIITRVGCFFNGCCYGMESDLPWAVHFPGIDGVRHPTQLYESLGGFIVVAVTFWFARKGKPGSAPVAFFMTYAPMRFLIEFIRDDPDRGAFGPFSTSQWVAIVTFALGAFLANIIRKMPASVASPSVPSEATSPARPSTKKSKKKKRK